VFPEFKFKLRASQQRVYDAVDDNAIINAWVSWGKTFTGLSIAAKLGQKTLVVTHTTNLRNQWEKEVQKCFGIKAGRIGSGEFNTSSPIVVGNIQSLYRRIDEIKHLFGTVILDEMHHVSSPTFTRIVDEMPSRFKVGLTGTLERKDGRHVVFRDYFGQDVHKPPKENYMIPEIDCIKSNIRFLDGSFTPWAERINHLTQNEEYIHSVALIASTYAAEGHKVLVVSDRVAFLKVCQRLVGENAVCITGDMDFTERENTMRRMGADRNILFGTQSIFSEGISLDVLSCLVLATPVNNEPLLTQLIGRVIRKKEGKIQPKIVDIHLLGKTAGRQANARMGYYVKQDYKVNIK
jgi:superfamily II DNA or RNA helicase